MTLIDILNRNSIISILSPVSKKQVFQNISAYLSGLTSLSESEIFEALMHRERLGSTSIGNGIAIPHAKFKTIDTLVGLFARLEKPIAFEALDEAPVDLVFVLLAPEGAGADHLKGLAQIARLLRDQDRIKRLRATPDADLIYSILCEAPNLKAA